MVSRGGESIFNSTKGWHPKSGIDGYHSDKPTHCIDLDKHFQIQAIKQTVYDYEDQAFYIIANRYKGKLGLFIFHFQEEDPWSFIENPDKHFLLKVKNKLEIDDVNLFVMRTMGKPQVIKHKTGSEGTNIDKEKLKEKQK